MMTLRDLIERQLKAAKKELEGHPDMYSAYGRAYWDGNIDCLNWVLEKIDNVRTSASKAKNNG